MNLHEAFIHIHQGCFAGTGAIVRLPQCQWSELDGYGKISQCITKTKHSKAKTVCICLGIYCMCSVMKIRFNFNSRQYCAEYIGFYWVTPIDLQSIIIQMILNLAKSVLYIEGKGYGGWCLRFFFYFIWVWKHNLWLLLLATTVTLSNETYRQVSNIRRTKSQHLKYSRTVLRLSLPNPLKPVVKSRMKM